MLVNDLPSNNVYLKSILSLREQKGCYLHSKLWRIVLDDDSGGGFTRQLCG